MFSGIPPCQIHPRPAIPQVSELLATRNPAHVFRADTYPQVISLCVPFQRRNSQGRSLLRPNGIHSKRTLGHYVGLWVRFLLSRSMALLSNGEDRYRNFLMVCAVLMVQPFEPLYFPLIDEPIPPSIRNLQQWIEIAWDIGRHLFRSLSMLPSELCSGFDPEGKTQLKKLVGTRKWIGTADLWIAFASRGIPLSCIRS